MPHEDPNVHLMTFLEIDDTVKMNGVTEDVIRMCLFRFSLRDKARGWLQSLQLGSINTWEELAQRFLSKFFLPSKTSQLRGKIAQFRQMDFEPLYEAWQRFKDLLRCCPQHGYQEWFQIQLFYNGLNGQTRTTIEAAASGTLLSKTTKEAFRLLEEMFANNYQWPGERSKKAMKIHEVDPIMSLSTQVSALVNQIAFFTTRDAASRELAMVANNNSYSGDGVGLDTEQCQFVNNKNYNF